MNRNPRLLAVALAAVTSLSACSLLSQEVEPLPQPQLPGDCVVAADKPVTLIVGARMGSPKPALPEEIRKLVAVAIDKNQKVQVVRVDGQPNVAAGVTSNITADSPTRRRAEVESLLRQIDSAVAKLAPKTAEANVLGALTEAAHVTPQGGTIVLIDSGIATSGPFTFRKKTMFGADPAEVADYLATQEVLPDLGKRSVVLAGVGNTAEPQAALDESLRKTVVGMWRAVVTKAGATCTSDVPGQTRRDRFDTTIPVTAVELPDAKPDFTSCSITVLDDSGSVGFVPDEAVFRDQAAAERTLKTLADKMNADRMTANLVGNTSSFGTSEPGRVDLSNRRALAVKEVLTRMGVAEASITTRGDGSTGKYHVNDREPNGALKPAEAAANRSVVVELACPR